MPDIKIAILNCLQQIKGSGQFSSIHSAPFVFPGLKIKGFGELAFPVSERQAKALIAVAHRAPFGKGTETIIDDDVRSGWEIDAEQFDFHHAAWQDFLDTTLEQIREDMGLEGTDIAAHPYKLLIYEEGDFFLPHQDSEKEKGMFGTLIIGLPSTYSGGSLEINFEGQTVTADFAGAEKYALNYAAFYADCKHQVLPLASGYRVNLVYNLVRRRSGEEILHQSIAQYAEQLSDLLKQAEKSNTDKPHIILLGHQYTPENFSEEALKLNDRAKAKALKLAAEKAGFYHKMCLVTSYLTGAPIYDGYTDYDDFGGESDAEMEEVIDSSLSIEHWLVQGPPSLNKVTFREEDLMTSFPLEEDEPIIKESTGYMGNWGPDLEHWYHYGAVMIWSPRVNAQLLPTQNTYTQLQWIDYFNTCQDHSELEANAIIHIIKTGLNNEGGWQKQAENFNPVIQWVSNTGNTDLFIELSIEKLQHLFCRIDRSEWIFTLNVLPSIDQSIFLNNISTDITLAVLEKLLALIMPMSKEEELPSLAKDQFRQLPHLFEALFKKETKPLSVEALNHLLDIADYYSPKENWNRSITISYTAVCKRTYIHKVLVPTLLSRHQSSTLADNLILFCSQFLQERTQVQPQPPKDWSRPIPQSSSYKEEWEILKDFMQSPEQQIFDYSIRKEKRAEMERTVRSAKADLKTETIKKGSPHTLRITKTQASYQRNLKAWKEDMALLKKIHST